MPHEVSYDENDKIVLMRAFGKVSPEEHIVARQQAAQLCREKKCLKVLGDLRDLDTEKSSTQDCFEFGESIVLEDIDPDTRLAIVVPRDLDSSQDVQFVSTVASNRGRFLWQFKTVEEAKKWLLKPKT
jgi:hypothetical protein